MISREGKYYLYRHIRLDSNKVFYVGIGTKRLKKPNCYTCVYERAYSGYRTKFWKSITAKTEYEVEIILESDDYKFIEQKEVEFIRLYGRRDLGEGPLCNLKDGGKGNRGKPCSEENKRYFAELYKNKKRPEIGDKVSSALKGKEKSAEHIEKLRLKAINEWKDGRKYSQNAIFAMNLANKRKIIMRDLDGNILKTYNSVKEVLEENNAARSYFYNCLNNNKKFRKKFYFNYGRKENN